jgi:hypothetical protein
MSEISNGNTVSAQGEELDDFDVEGHGLKEIALGLSAASIVASGAGAAALAMDNPAPGTTSGAQTVVAGVQSDLDERRGWAVGVGDRAVDFAGSTTQDVQRTTDRTVTVVTTTVTPVTDLANAAVSDVSAIAGDAVADASDLANRTVANPIGTADRAVDSTMVVARETRDNALITATDAVSKADKAAADAVTLVGETADSGVRTARNTPREAQQIVDQADPSADVQMKDGGVQAEAHVAGTSVSANSGG